MKPITIDRALTDPRFLGAALDDPASWSNWIVVLSAAFGLTLDREMCRAFAAVAGSRKPPKQKVRELWCILGRRSGKTRMAAAIGLYLALFVPHKLAPGVIGALVTHTPAAVAEVPVPCPKPSAALWS